MSGTRHTYRIHIQAPIETVWAALIEPDLTRRYFHGTAFAQPPVAGQGYRTVMPDGSGAVDGTIEAMEPPNRLVMTWRTLYNAALAEEPPSRVEWNLTTVGDSLTRVDLVHGDLFKSPGTWANVKDGWVWILDCLKTLLETGEPLPPVTATNDNEETGIEATGAWHRAAGVEANNNAWTYLSTPSDERTAADDEEMRRHAYASAYHWQRAAGAGPANEARACWMLSRVWCVQGRGDLALEYADRVTAVCAEHGLVDFDLAYAHEARARALACLGRTDEAASERIAARAVAIADPEDLAIVESDLADGPWFGLPDN